MASCEATGPPVIVWCAADQGGHVGARGEVLDRAQAIRAIAAITEIGSRMRTTLRTRSTQKLPSRSVFERVNPRISATATAMPTAADDEVLHREAGHLDEVAHRGLAGVGLPVRVGHERRRGVERQRRVDARGSPGTAAGGPGPAGARTGTTTLTREKASTRARRRPTSAGRPSGRRRRGGRSRARRAGRARW